MLKPALQLKLGQQLTMTPQLQQAIKLLQMPVLELQAQVQEALEANVMLEAEEEEPIDLASLDPQVPAPAPDHEPDADHDVGGETTTIEADADDEVIVEMEDPWAESSTPSGDGQRADDDDDRPLEFTDERGRDLHQHLVWQLETSQLDPREVWIGEAIVDSLNDDGYLTESPAELASSLSADLPVSAEDVERILRFVQTLDPPGIGARDLAECLCLQLEQLEPETSGRELALAIARNHLSLVAARDHTTLKRMLAADEESLQVALALIRGCHPRPGSAFESAQPQYIVPDVFVRRTEHGWTVEINAASVPRLKVNQTYASLVARSGDYATLRAQLQEARWLIRSLEIRSETLLKVARTIVQRQSAFFERGDEAMQPMILRDVAEAVSMHESTISRVTTGKYMHTPRGIFEFRYFFSSHVSGMSGEDVSSIKIRARIRKLIGDESPDKPLSDAQLAEILAGEGAKVA
ncbi:MAG TPA: RNA polymerase factor sigma-54, partial [Kofleriaceae bacterium]|nr:RNA polymerase factor sigma-54 [Kofleriaceae bacterium]